MKIQALREQGLEYEKTLNLCESSEHDTLNTPSNQLFLQDFELLTSCDSLKCQFFMFSFDFNTSPLRKIVIFIVIVLHGSMVVCSGYNVYH